MFTFLGEVVLRLAQGGAARGVRLVGAEDAERVMHWLRAEGLPPSELVYRALLVAMVADARWGLVSLGRIAGP